MSVHDVPVIVIPDDFVENWCAALRSDHYRPARSVLRTRENTFCCLGVMCNEIDETIWKVSNPDQFSVFEYFDGCEELPHHWVIGAIATKYNLTFLEVDDFFHDLAKKNDAGMSFEKIADVIEAFFRGTNAGN